MRGRKVASGMLVETGLIYEPGPQGGLLSVEARSGS